MVGIHGISFKALAVVVGTLRSTLSIDRSSLSSSPERTTSSMYASAASRTTRNRDAVSSPDNAAHLSHIHNPYPPPAPRETTGRRMSAVLAAVAGSDLEYSGIMRPPNDAVYDDRQPPGYRSALRDIPPRPPNALTPSYASSSERQPSIESTRMSGLSVSPHRTPWEQGYRDARPVEQPAAAAPPPPSEPASERPKKRRRKAPAANGSDIPEGAQVEYEDASGDPSRGPVFIHPPKGSVQACVRCHRIKRKCDGLWPRCKSCERSDVACVFELNPATSRWGGYGLANPSYVHKLKNATTRLEDEVSAAHERIRFLESQMNKSNDDLVHPQPVARPPPDFVGLSSSALSIKEHAALPLMEGARSMSLQRSISAQPSAANVPLSDLLSHEDALKAVQVYLEFNGLAYPCIERADLPRWVNELYGVAQVSNGCDGEVDAPVTRRGTPSSTSEGPENRLERRKFIIYLVLAIGTNASERAGDGPSGPSLALYQAAMQYRAKALEHEDILCVQALIVLALWTLSNPSTGSMWQVTGLCARVITSIGLHRRADPNTRPHIAEQRRRVFYSWYNIERVLAPTLCKPLAIAESDIDIELPSPNDDDHMHRGMQITWVLKHVIGYRRLMGKVLTELYSVNNKNNRLPEADRRAIIRDLHTEIDDWIVGAPVANPKDSERYRANHRHWWQILYHQLLASLYRPSPLCPTTTPETLRALYDASSHCVDLYIDMCAVNKTSFHLLQIIGLFVSCISLLCCLCECDARMRGVAHEPQEASSRAELGLGRYSGPDDPAWATEIRTRVAQCHNLFDVFGHKLPASARYRDTFFRLSELLLARYGPLGPVDGKAGGEGEQDDHEQEHEQGQAEQEEHDQTAQPHPLLTNTVLDTTAIDPSLQLDKTILPPAHPQPADNEMAGAWDAMTQLWFELGDLFGEESDPFAQFEDSWVGWGGNAAANPAAPPNWNGE